jgi:hypothetical protein
MKKLLIILGLVIISISAMAQGTIETMRDAGDSLTTAPYNGYLYGVYGSTQFVYRPFEVYAPLTLTKDRTIDASTYEFVVQSTDGASQSVTQYIDDGVLTISGHPTPSYTNTTSRFIIQDGITHMRATSGGNSTTVQVDNSAGVTITDNINSAGAKYAQDYSTNFTARSLTDKGYVDTGLGAKVDTATTFDYDTTVWMLTDTIILGAFSAVDSFNTSFIYGSFYQNGSDTLVVTEMMACLQGTTPSLTVDIEWHATLGSGSATGLNTTPPTITSVTTGDSDTTFDNAEIPPGVFVWLKTPTVTTAPTFMTVTLLGYRKNSTY